MGACVLGSTRVSSGDRLAVGWTITGTDAAGAPTVAGHGWGVVWRLAGASSNGEPVWIVSTSQ